MGRTWPRAIAIACLALAFLAGCADLTVNKLTPNGNPIPPEGQSEIAVPNAPFLGQLTYFLPRTAVNIAVSVTVQECGSLSSAAPPDDNTPEDEKPSNKTLKFAVKATATPSLEADPNYEYAINYRDAESWMKEINYTLNITPNKVLQSFNGTINDQTGPVVLGVLSAAVQIAGAVAIPTTGALAIANAASRTVEKTSEYSFTINGVTHHGTKKHTEQVTPPPGGPKDAKDYCTTPVQNALTAIAKAQVTIKSLKAKIEAYRESIGSSDKPQKFDPTTVWSNAITALQSEIADQTASHLTQSETIKWLPDLAPRDGDLANFQSKMLVYPDGDYTLHAALYQIPISSMVTKFLSSGVDGDDPDRDGASWYANVTHNNVSDDYYKVWYKAHAPYSIVVVLDGRTLFDQGAYDRIIGDKNDPLAQPDAGGLVVRDPAIGFMQNCLVQTTKPAASWPALAQIEEGTWGYASLGALPCVRPRITRQNTTADNDDNSRVPLSMPQFGRPLVFDAHSRVFENASLGLTLNADGTISSVVTHDTSTAAAGLATLATTAQAAATAQATHNTAVAAENTSVMNQMQIPDNTNKYYADCLSQAASIVKAGGVAAPCPAPKP